MQFFVFDELSKVVNDNTDFNITLTVCYFKRCSHVLILFIEDRQVVLCLILTNPKSNYVNDEIF